MDRLRPRHNRLVFCGFTTPEIEKMEKLCKEPREQSLDQEFYKRLAKSFNCSKGRAGKPVLKWTEVQSWFQDRQLSYSPKDATSPKPPKKLSVVPEACPINKTHESPLASKGEKVPDLSELEFEARSSKDGAWYVNAILKLDLTSHNSGH